MTPHYDFDIAFITQRLLEGYEGYESEPIPLVQAIQEEVKCSLADIYDVAFWIGLWLNEGYDKEIDWGMDVVQFEEEMRQP